MIYWVRASLRAYGWPWEGQTGGFNWRRHHRKMKATEMANKPRQTSRANRRGTLTGSGLALETKIFSASGRGRNFFLDIPFYRTQSQHSVARYGGITPYHRTEFIVISSAKPRSHFQQ